MSTVRLQLDVTITYDGDEQIAIHEALGAIESAASDEITDVTVDAWTVEA